MEHNIGQPKMPRASNFLPAATGTADPHNDHKIPKRPTDWSSCLHPNSNLGCLPDDYVCVCVGLPGGHKTRRRRLIRERRKRKKKKKKTREELRGEKENTLQRNPRTACTAAAVDDGRPLENGIVSTNGIVIC